MIIKSAAGKAFAAICLTAIATFPRAHAQMSPALGAYGPYGPRREPTPRGANMSRHRLGPN